MAVSVRSFPFHLERTPLSTSFSYVRWKEWRGGGLYLFEVQYRHVGGEWYEVDSGHSYSSNRCSRVLRKAIRLALERAEREHNKNSGSRWVEIPYG